MNFISEINKRRIKQFKSNKRGYYSFLIFSLLFTISLFAEFVANDKPVILSYKGELYFPVVKEYSETIFGGDFETEANYKDKKITTKIEAEGWMIWPIIRFHYSTINYNLPAPAPTPPSRDNWLGTDDQGRDVMARVIYGFRISVLFGLSLTIFSSIIGIIAGAIQGYLGGITDLLMQRFIEIWSGLPVLFILIILSGMVQPNFWWLLGIMLLFSWISLVSVVRAECLKTRNLDYIKAARAIGVSEIGIIFRHILPNATISAMTLIPFLLSSSITTLTSLDFLGLGLPPGSPSLGELLAQGKDNIYAIWLGITGFTVLSAMLTMLIFTGEAFRDAINPHRNR